MKSKKIKSREKRNSHRFLIFPFLIIALPFFIFITQLQFKFITLAQTPFFQAPPMFFCLAVGESDKNLCASSSLEAKTNLELNGFTLNTTKTVYYNDTLTGSASYTNAGDIPVKIKKITLTAKSSKSNKQVEFNPNRQSVTVQPGKTVTVSGTSRMFASPDPGGVWQVYSSVILADGQRVDNTEKTSINVSTACTALRAIPLSNSDLSNLKQLCAKDPKTKLCSSRQYCELTGGDNCTQSAPQQKYLENQLQCDAYIIIPEEEQPFLQEFCKAYPGADTCKNFCGRTLDADNCPDPNIAASGTTMVAGIKIAKANTSCKSGVSNYIGQCCATKATYISPNGNELCGSAPAGGGTAPAPQKNAPQCASGFANKIGQCCAVGTCLVNGICSRACGGGGAGGGTGGGGTTCASGTKNKIGQCCKYSGPLTAGGLCPIKAGGGTVSRITPVKGTPARTCATGSVRNAAGVCVPSGGGLPGPGQDCRLGSACSAGLCTTYAGAPAGMGVCSTR